MPTPGAYGYAGEPAPGVGQVPGGSGSGSGSAVGIGPSPFSATVMQSAITAAAAVGGGEIVLLAGVHSWNTAVPKIPPGIANRLTIRGEAGAVISLSNSAPRAFDWGKVADYDTFQNVTIGNLKIDCNGIGGKNHTVIGPLQGSFTWQRKIHLYNVHVRDIDIVNAPVGTDSAVDFRIGVHIGMAASSADQTCRATRCSVKRIWSDGCLQLVAIHGVPVGEATANTFHDDIFVSGIRHDIPTVPAAFNAGAHVMAGTKGTGGRITISNVRGKNSPDVGVEWDGWQTAVLNDIQIEDAYDAAFYHVNYNPPALPAEQISTLTNCVPRRVLVQNHGQGFVAEPKNGNNPGEIVFGEGCAYYRASTVAGFQSTPFTDAPGEAASLNGVPRISGRVMCFVDYPTYDDGGAGTDVSPATVWVSNPDNVNRCAIEGLQVVARITGARAGTGTINHRTAVLRDGLFTDMNLDVQSTVKMTNLANAAIYHAQIGSVAGAPGATTLSGKLRVTIPVTGGGGGNTPTGIRFESQAFTSVEPNNRLLIHGCDFAGLAATSSSISYAGDGTLAKSMILRDNRWRDGNQPANPSISTTGTTSASNLYDAFPVTATGATKTIQLPITTRVPTGKVIRVYDVAGDAAAFNIVVTIAAAGTFADGTASKSITTNYGSLTFIMTGSGWLKV